jgi:hypothetical protein
VNKVRNLRAPLGPRGLERSGGSHGPAGMRERGIACGGRLTSGRAAAGGWLVPGPAAAGGWRVPVLLPAAEP